MSIRPITTPGGQCAGFTLLEALVTIVVVSIGLLGILGLQTVSIANTQSSAARSTATIAADNLADRMRVNAGAARDGDYESIPSSEPSACTTASPCDPEAMAARDLWEWNQGLGDVLPRGAGDVSCEQSVGSDCISYRVTVLWRERDADGASAAGDPSTAQCDDSDALVSGCFQTVIRP